MMTACAPQDRLGPMVFLVNLANWELQVQTACQASMARMGLLVLLGVRVQLVPQGLQVKMARRVKQELMVPQVKMDILE